MKVSYPTVWKRRRPLLVALIAIPVFAAGLAQAATRPAPPPACAAMLQRIKGGGSNDDLVLLSKSQTCFYELALPGQAFKGTLRALAVAQDSASTVQTGAPSSSNGTTSAVSKPATPLALATEYGGITSSTSNQTITLQTTLDGIPTALAAQGVVPYCISALVNIPGCVGWKNQQLLNRFGVGITANTTSASQSVNGMAGATQGTAQQASLSSAGLKAPSLSSVFAKATLWRGTYQLPAKGPSGVDLEQAQFALAYGLGDVGAWSESNPLPLMPGAVWTQYQNWQQTCIDKVFTQDKLKDMSDQQMSDLFFRYYAKIVGILFDGKSGTCDEGAQPPVLSGNDLIAVAGTSQQRKLINAFETYMAAASLFEAQLNQMVLAAAKPVLSFEYDYNTPVNQPTTSTAKLIFSKAGFQKKCGSNKKTLTVATTTLPSGKINASYSVDVRAVGGTPPYTWQKLSGDLPSGLQLDPDTGKLSGTPSTEQLSNFTIEVVDALNHSAKATLTISTGVLAVITRGLANAPAGHGYNARLTAIGGAPSYKWSIYKGNLPPGLSLSDAGEISGRPQTPPTKSKSASYSFTVQATDSSEPQKTATASLSIEVGPSPNPCANATGGACINQLTGTLNAGGNFYNSTPSSVPGAQSFRDAQVGAEVDWAFCTSAINVIGSFLGNSTLGFTYYYQDQTSPSILKVTPGMPVSGINIVGLASTTSSVFATKGPINFAQIKYGLGTGKNVKFPIAFSYSNRTDLITKQLWSAQFGVSYDFSSLFNSNSSNSNSSNGSGGGTGGQ